MARKGTSVAIVLGMVFLAVSSAFAVPVKAVEVIETFPITEDTWLSENDYDTNFGSSQSLRIGRYVPGTFVSKKGEILFNVDMGKSFGTIYGAYVTLYYYDPPALESSARFSYVVVATAPMTGENGPTWRNSPLDQRVLTQTKNFGLDPIGHTLDFVIDDVDYLENKQSFTLKLKQYYALIDNSGWSRIYFRSSEYGEVGQRPYFVVRYEDGKNIFEGALAWIMSAFGSIVAFLASLSSCLFINRKNNRPIN